jgi:hypothetical protein
MTNTTTSLAQAAAFPRTRWSVVLVTAMVPLNHQQQKGMIMHITKSNLLAALAVGALCGLSTPQAPAQNIESMPPVVVKAVPESGAKDVAPGTVEIRVTFSKEMTDNSWSWSGAWQGSTPESVGKPKYEKDGKTCVIKVKLEPGKTYAYWINSARFQGFKDQQGHPAVPYLLVFQTKEK